jgi:hypothetical protein
MYMVHFIYESGEADRKEENANRHCSNCFISYDEDFDFPIEYDYAKLLI